MKFKRSIFAALVFSVLFTSCFNNLKAPKETSVSFYMDEATVQKILQTSTKARSAASSRAAADEQNDTAGYFIDVTLIGEVEQTQTASLSTDVQMSFTNILVNSRVYAKAQIYKYLNSEQTEKEIIYRGESKKITVRDNGNVLSIKLTTATLTVTFDSNGGSEVPSQLVLTGSAAIEPEKPVKPADKKKYSRENYAFAGWFTDPELTKEYNFELPVKDDLTLYAKWLPDFVFVEGATVNDYLVTGRNIKISDLFVSDHEVTQAEYKAVIGSNPSNNKTADDLPVENVTWLEAIEYCNKLSENQGLDPCYKINGSEVTCTLSANGYRLPTEAEWEYIAGKAKRENTSFANLAWTADNSGNNTHQVKYNLADELCLCDIYGNVAEWCFDVYSEAVTKSTGATGPMAVAGTSANRVVRGGSFQSSAADCTPQARASADPAEKSAAIGFRVVRTVVYEFKIARNTVTFEPNGGSSVEVQIVIQGDCATEPAAPTRTGYIFKGWQYADEDFDFSTSITQDIMLEAKWEAIQYTIKFDKGTSTTTVTMPDQVFTYDVAVSLPGNTFEPDTGMKFAGWTTDPSSTNIEYENEQVIKNLSAVQGDEITLYALWIDRDACAITFLDIPEGVTNTNDASFLIRDDVTLNELTRDFYDFSGWYLVKEDSTEEPVSGWIAGTYQTNIKLRATWTPIEYNWTFECNGGSWNSYTPTATYNVTQNITLPDSSKITRQGYEFAGWYIGSDDTNIISGWIAGEKHEAAGITLNAKWNALSNHYKVQHWKQKPTGGENIATSYDCVEEQTIDENVKTGDTTAATAKAYDGFTSKSFEQTTVAADGSTVINIYYNRNTITYTYTLGSGESWGASESPNEDNNVVKEGLYGATVVLPQVKKTGYDFGNWKSGAITLTSTSTYGLENKTFTATWGIQTYEIRYHLNGGSYANFTGGTYDSEYDIYTKTFTTNDGLINLTVPEREGFTFGEGEDEVWFTDDRTFTTTISSIDATQTRYLKDWDVYAKWTYTVTFNSNGGSAVSTQIKPHTNGVEEPTPPTKGSLTFGGWYSDSDFTTPFTFGTVPGTTTLYAKWTYKVTYVVNGGTTVSEQTYLDTQGVTKPSPNPTRTNYSFGNWCSDENLTTQYTFGNAETSDITLYAKWNYKVTYNSNGGSSVSARTYAHNQSVPRPSSDPTRNGYTFDDWYSDEGLTTKFAFNTIPSGGNITLYAKWNPISYTITYEKDGGDFVSGYTVPESYTIATSVTLPTADDIKKGNYRFDGWYLSTDSTQTVVETISTGTTGDKSYTAKWTAPILKVVGSTTSFAYSKDEAQSLIIGTDNDTDTSLEIYLCAGATSFIGSSYDQKTLGYSIKNSKYKDVTVQAIEGETVPFPQTCTAVFNGCTKLISINMTNFNFSNVTGMANFFNGCENLVTITGFKNLNLENVTNIMCLFENCKSLTSLDLTNLRMPKVTYQISSVFKNCESLTSLDLSSLDFSGRTRNLEMSYFFYNCKNLESLVLPDYFVTEKTTTINSMFRGCEKLTSLDLSKFETSSVTDMDYLFMGCTALTSVNLSSFDTANLTTMSYIFANCSSIRTIDMSTFTIDSMTSTTSINGMFSGCSLLETIYVSRYFDVSATVSGWDTNNGVFSNCSTNLKGGNGTTWSSSNTKGLYLRIDTAETPGYLTKKQ